ncbi:MlaE family lipid ABC transporter permease subunit [Aquibium carbonis]|uniref:MlaE family lipid ABC transporter permease subunit n=1 Tax=Aquibium carbonis TaxID=2495581 RepID=A0A429Z266_9HYPH|nr:MlaE family lipid ABC transporter permease subunit [Aquibium carbonis]RST87805.1 MlaE family lipid ABC transporter permease subunit [Aquibium carbonis]
MLTKDQADASASEIASEPHPKVRGASEDGRLVVTLSGNWTTRTVSRIDREMRALEDQPGVRGIAVDLAGVGEMDTAGAWVIKRLAVAQERKGATVEMTGGRSAFDVLLAAVEDAALQELPPAEVRPFGIVPFMESIGRSVFNARDEFLLAMHILGATLSGNKRRRGRKINLAPLAMQIDRMGIGAIPVVVLMSTIVGAIVAQQGAFQLRYFGAEIFVVDLVGILVLREMGVLLTAIMIAGRSGSAITAEIGSMKMREEVDALTVIGLNPIGVLVFPRLVALAIIMPLLTIIANIAAIAGAMAVAWAYSGITPDAFFDRMTAAIDESSLLSGLFKAPIMGIIIGLIASVEGMKVGGSAESLGRQVTSSVVKAIFVVIVVDGLFAMFYAAIDF